MSDLKRPAYVGSPTNIAPAKVFDWLFSDPFETASDFTPDAHIVSKVEDERPVFVDEATSRHLPQPLSSRS